MDFSSGTDLVRGKRRITYDRRISVGAVYPHSRTDSELRRLPLHAPAGLIRRVSW
jgi:hypothetical protein